MKNACLCMCMYIFDIDALELHIDMILIHLLNFKLFDHEKLEPQNLQVFICLHQEYT